MEFEVGLICKLYTGEMSCNRICPCAVVVPAVYSAHLVCLLQLFTLVTEAFSKHGGTVKELTRWAYEIYLTFLAEHAVIDVTAVLCLRQSRSVHS